MRTGRTVEKETLDEIIRRIVEVAQPEKIILFGSAARGDSVRAATPSRARKAR